MPEYTMTMTMVFYFDSEFTDEGKQEIIDKVLEHIGQFGSPLDANIICTKTLEEELEIIRWQGEGGSD